MIILQSTDPERLGTEERSRGEGNRIIFGGGFGGEGDKHFNRRIMLRKDGRESMRPDSLT